MRSLAGVGSQEPQRFEPDGYVYVLAGGGYYKVGRTTRLSFRVPHLKTQLPFKVELEHAFPCSDVNKAEAALHRRFANGRANGEWFALEEEDVEFLKSIGRMRGEEIEFGEVVHVPDFESPERLTVQIDADLLDKVRDAVYWTPGLTLSGFVERALLAEVERLEQERGGAYPPRTEELRGGRPMK